MTAVAYLVSQYPALSHAFIEREVAELRAGGCEVTVLSVRRPEPGDLRTEAARAEAAATVAIQGLPARTLVADGLAALVSHPVALAATVRHGLGPGRGVRGRLKRLAYVAEAIPVHRRLRDRGLRHLHVHFANNAADIADIAVHLGARIDGPATWSWSMSMHGPTEFADPVGYRLPAKVASAAFVACISDFCRRQLLAVAPRASVEDLPIVHMGVDTRDFPAAGAERAARVAATGTTSATGSPGPLRVLFVGRLVPEKAPVDLVEAVARTGRPVEVRIVGNGPLRADVEARIAALGLGGSVRCLGGLGQDELPAHYGWADVFCLPSHAEGVPVVLMEAMSTELPVVTTTIAGIPELVDETNGVLVSPGDVDAVAGALRLLADDAELRAALGRRGRETVLRDYRSAVNAARLRTRFDALPTVGAVTVDGAGGAMGVGPRTAAAGPTELAAR